MFYSWIIWTIFVPLKLFIFFFLFLDTSVLLQMIETVRTEISAKTISQLFAIRFNFDKRKDRKRKKPRKKTKLISHLCQELKEKKRGKFVCCWETYYAQHLNNIRNGKSRSCWRVVRCLRWFFFSYLFAIWAIWYYAIFFF